MNAEDKFGKIKKKYTTVAIISLNLFLIFFVINLFIYIFFPTVTLKPVGSKMIYGAYSPKIVQEGYPNLTPGQVTDLLDETWSHLRIYEPYTAYKEAPTKGTYVNISEDGFRLISTSTQEQGVWPVSKNFFNIFVFGGSTTFGYGVADNESIPAHLQRVLSQDFKNVRVYNFGRAGYFSLQERALFEQLLLKNQKPDLAIFVDGMNDIGHGDPDFTDELQNLMAHDPKTYIKGVIELLPLKHFISFAWTEKIKKLWAGGGGVSSPAPSPTKADFDRVYLRYVHNKEMTESSGRLFGVPTLFVWQPVPVYSFDITKHPFAQLDKSLEGRPLIKYTYDEMDKLRKTGEVGRDFVWCADVGLQVKGRAYIDLVHYSSEMSAVIAKCIADSIKERGLVE